MVEQVHRTVCNRDCPDACSMHVVVRNGRAVQLRGDPDDPITAGFLCERTNRFLRRQYADDRITTPLVRRGGELVPISWDDALDLASEKLVAAKREHGAASILHYKSGGSLGLLKDAPAVVLSAFGPVTTKRGDICSGAGEAAQELDFGVSDSHAVEDLHNSETILLWGRNPHTSGVHLLPFLKAARARGAKIFGVDPVRTRAASLCDGFLTPRPGADYALAMLVARWLFDQDAVDPSAGEYCDNLDAFRRLAFARDVVGWAEAADVPVDAAVAMAERYGTAKPASLLVGWGLARRANGAKTVRALDALGAISGNLGVPGGGVSYYFQRSGAFDKRFGQPAVEPPRTFSETHLGAEILSADEPPVRVAWITAGNPVSMLPSSNTVREALRRTDFTVVVDTHPTDTTDVADLVLPTLTLLEDDDVLGAYGNHYLRASTPAIEPPDGPRHEVKIWQALAERLGVQGALPGTIAQLKRRTTSRLAKAGVALEALERGAVQNPFAAKVLFEDRRFATSTGRVQLLDEAPAPAPEPTTQFPLTLLATSVPHSQSSQRSTPVPDGPPEVRVHPSNAGGLADGAHGKIVSAVGTLLVAVVHDEALRPDIALMEKGGMLRDRRCVNALVRAVETDHGGGAAYYDELVRLESL